MQINLLSLKIVEDKLSHLPELETAVVGIFTTALFLCGICTKYIQQGRISGSQPSLLPTKLALLVETFHDHWRRTLTADTEKALRALISGQDEGLKQATNDFYKAVKLGQDTIGKLLLANSVDIKLVTSSTAGELTGELI